MLKKRQSEAESKIKTLEERIESSSGNSQNGSNAEVAQIRKEVESERNRFKKALAELRRRNDMCVRTKAFVV